MTNGGPVNELAIARSLRRLTDIAARHPELIDHTVNRGDNRAAWEAALAELEEKDTMARNAKEPPSTQLAIRLPIELMERIDRHVERMEAATPGIGANRTLAVRTLIAAALDAIEAAPRRGKRG